ncbi:hypothetical protein Tco_0812202 [Tanacetum coccineum]
MFAQHPTTAIYSALTEDMATDCYFSESEYPLRSNLGHLRYHRPSDGVPFRVSLTGLPARSCPRLFEGTIGVFTEELSSKKSKECTFDIHLENYEVHICSEGKKDPDCFHSCHWFKGFIIVNSFFMTITLYNLSCFVLSGNSLFILLVPEHPFGAYAIHSLREVCVESSVPNFVSIELVQLFLHCINPSWML